MPKSFQDAAILAYGIGIEYLWIDSLCIIQDDHQDWAREAPTMGELYHHASLVIAAAGARNSAEGVFVTNRPATAVLKLPWIRDGAVIGSFHLTGLSGDRQGPSYSILRTRAWVFQEWRLARRLIFFMPGGISWNCRSREYDERGCRVDLGLMDDFSWEAFLTEYTATQITYPSDRLITVQGIVNDMRPTRDADCKYGVWDDDIARQLLWVPADVLVEDMADLPSWSWASTQGKKYWAMESSENETSATFLSTLEMTESGAIEAGGCLLKKAKTCKDPDEALFLEDLLDNPDSGLDDLDRVLADCDEASWFLGRSECQLLLDFEDEKTIVGIARFDNEDDYVLPVHCLSLVEVCLQMDEER